MMKRKGIIFIIVICVIILAVGVTSMALWLPRSMKRVVPEDTGSIVKILKMSSMESPLPERLSGTETALNSEYYSEFIELARSIKYVRFYNFRGWKCSPVFSSRYVIYYENGEYIEVTVALHHQSGSDTVRYAYLVNDPFPEIEKLFEEHSVA